MNMGGHAGDGSIPESIQHATDLNSIRALAPMVMTQLYVL